MMGVPPGHNEASFKTIQLGILCLCYLPGLIVAIECPLNVVGSLLRERRHPWVEEVDSPNSWQRLSLSWVSSKSDFHAHKVCVNFVSEIRECNFFDKAAK
jgi:hypothetical protein